MREKPLCRCQDFGNQLAFRQAAEDHLPQHEHATQTKADNIHWLALHAGICIAATRPYKANFLGQLLGPTRTGHLRHIKQDCKKVGSATGNDKHVPNRMKMKSLDIAN